MWVAKYATSSAFARSTAAAAVSTSASPCKVTQVGGTSSTSPAACRSRAAAAEVQTWSPISPPSTTTSAAPGGRAATKNHVEKRLGASGGGTQWAKGTSASAS